MSLCESRWHTQQERQLKLFSCSVIFILYCCYPTKWNVDVGKLGMLEIHRRSIIERGVRTKWCWRNHRAETLTNHHTKNSHEINMNVARFSIFFCCFWVDFLSAIWVFSLFFTLDSIFFSIAIYDLYVIHISRYLCCDIFIFIEFIFMFSCVCDSILLGFYAISFNYTFKVFRLILQIEAQKCEVVSFIY